jgi:hypothetical protein
MSENTTAERFTERLMEHRSEEQKEQYRKYFKLGEGEGFVGVRMGRDFELAKEFIEMLPDEIKIVTRKPCPRSARWRTEHQGQTSSPQKDTQKPEGRTLRPFCEVPG